MAPPLGTLLGHGRDLLRGLSAHRQQGLAALIRRLVLVLGDQLHPLASHPALAGFDPAQDRLLMAEVAAESTHVWSHKARIVMFLAAMRHFAGELLDAALPMTYLRLDEHPHATLAAALAAEIASRKPAVVRLAEPGDWRLLAGLQDACAAAGVPLELLPDPHFLCSTAEFHAWAGSRRSLRLENFYRWLRTRLGVLMDGDEPAGGRWNFDAENRRPWPADGPGADAGSGRHVPLPQPPAFAPDDLTRSVMDLVGRRFAGHPGRLEAFTWPVTRSEALVALADFVARRLPFFGDTQDAMHSRAPFGHHALLSAALNLKLLDPREVIATAEAAWRNGGAPLPSVEGFIRQVLGWREYVRGIYWRSMPALATANRYGHQRALPGWYWSGTTSMNCLGQAIAQTLEHGYAHHIQRLMLTGNFALLAGIEPRQVADWYLAIYVDAVAWVEEPNTLGMALDAFPGMTSKPYCASGAYVRRMSDYCRSCAYRPEIRTGPKACPLTTLYWHFLDREEPRLRGNARLALALAHLERLGDEERAAIRAWGDRLLADLDAL